MKKQSAAPLLSVLEGKASKLPVSDNPDFLASGDRANLQQMQLLLVEDNEVNQKVASKFLSKWGVQIDYAMNGLIAVEKVKNKQYDVVLMDLQMPEMDGYEATKTIRSLDGPYYRELPIVALTASTLVEVKDKVSTVGMTDYLCKPFNASGLYLKISQYNRKNTADEKPVTLAEPKPEVMINFEQLTKATANNPNFARQMVALGIEALNNFKEEYRLALLNRELTRLRAIRHKSHFLFHLLELEQILSEISHGEQLLKAEPTEEVALLESSAKMQMLCEAVVVELQNIPNE